MSALIIGGRKFKPVGEVTTLRHDLSTQAQLQRAGLHRLEMLPAESPDDYALRIFRTATMNTDVLLLIGHLILPEENKSTDWTPEMSQEIAVWLGSLTDPDEKRKVQNILTSALIDFLTAGLVYAVASLRSSILQESTDALPETETAA